jgi:hypothetical protein
VSVIDAVGGSSTRHVSATDLGAINNQSADLSKTMILETNALTLR